MGTIDKSEQEVIADLAKFVEEMEEKHNTEGGFEFWDDDGGWMTDFDNHSVEVYTIRNWRTNAEEERSYTRYGTLDRRLVPGVGYVKNIEQFGGEGMGDQYYIILRIDPLDSEGETSGSRFFKIDGYYASHYGRDLDGPMYEVFPQQKTITVYNKKGR